MFHFKHPTRQHTSYSPFWHDTFSDSQSEKRVVKKTHTEPYEPVILASSIHKACMKAVGFSGEAELTAMKVCKDLEAWLMDKEEVTAADIKRIAAATLQKYNPRAAYEYLPMKQYKVQVDDYGFIRL